MKVYNIQSDNALSPLLLQKLQVLRQKRSFDEKQYIIKKCELLNSYMKKCKLSACVVAVSGGIDSAIVLALVNQASKMPNSPIKKIIPLCLPIFRSSGVTNQKQATERGEELCKALQLKCYSIDISSINEEIRNSLEPQLGIIGQDWAIGQLGPYSRTPVLYYTTSLLNQAGFSAVICGTTNLSEGGYLGYVGKASDGLVDIQLISDIYKSEVYKVAKCLNIPKSIIDVVPSGDMYDSRTDEVVFGAPYDFVELYLNYLNFTEKQKQEFVSDFDEISKQQFELYSKNLENLHKYNAHKYLSKSPAVHLDLFDSHINGGWENHYQITKNFMES